MVFDIKMEDFRRKARLVAGGHMTDAPPTITYVSVVSRDTVRLALTIAALNALEVKAADILNAYIQAPATEKIWTILGPELSEDAGEKAIIVCDCYGLKSSSAAFRNHLADCMRHLGYTSCPADPDLWMKPKTRPNGGFEYYSYVLCYVDDILVIPHDSMSILDRNNKYFPLKEGSAGDPDMYLGAKLRKFKLPNGVMAWSMSSSKYAKEAMQNCKKHIEENFDDRYKLPKRAENPFAIGYEPSLDVTAVLGPDEASYFNTLLVC
jgi:hypothetical protein